MKDCLFCKIVAGEIPSHKVYEDDKFLAFLDINPINKGHTLVIPKEHSYNLITMDDELAGEMMKVIKKLAQHIKEKLNADGINIIFNNEKSAGQIIFHTHAHIIPRFEGDGFHHWPGKPYLENEANEILERLK